MDLDQIWNGIKPYLTPLASIAGFIAAAWKLYRNHVEIIHQIKTQVAVVQTNQKNQSTTISEVKSDLKEMQTQISQIAHDVATIKAQEHGALNLALEKIEEMQEQFLSVLEKKFPEYDRKIAVIVKQNKRKKNVRQ